MNVKIPSLTLREFIPHGPQFIMRYPEPVEDLLDAKMNTKWLEPTDHDAGERATPLVDGLGDFLKEVKTRSEVYISDGKPSPMAEFLTQVSQQYHREDEQRRQLQQRMMAWESQADPQIAGDPYSTVFIARMDYSVSEIELSQRFSAFGEISHVRVVRDTQTGKSRGYGFVVYTESRDADMAYRRANGMEINGRNILVDRMRGRASKNWYPRRLGGGLGGRESKKEVEPVHHPGFRGGFRGRGRGRGFRGGFRGRGGRGFRGRYRG